MVAVEYEGRVWQFAAPGPAFALEVRKLADTPQRELSDRLADHVLEHMDLDDWVWLVRHRRDLPVDAVPELFMRWLEEATGKPMSAVGALSNVTVRSWSMVRGRLVMAGIPNPLADLPSLAALLDVVDVMIREGHKDENETKKYEREVFRPRTKTGTIEKPAGFDDGDMSAQAAMLEAMGD